MRLKIWGTRGSIPVPGKHTLKYGGNTPCIQVTLNSGEIIIIDAGSGIRELAKELQNNNSTYQITIFITHTHWDHIQGIPFFSPLFDDNYTINILSAKKDDCNISHIIDGQINHYFFPITSSFLKAKINYREIEELVPIYFGNSTVTPVLTKHSNGTFAYKVIEGNKSIVYMTDNEIEYNLIDNKIDTALLMEKNKSLIDFCRGADYLIHDCMYEYADYKKGWGHSNHHSVAVFSHLAEVKNLVLFHYDPDYNDEKVDALVDTTKEILGKMGSKVNCLASYEGMIL